MEVSSESDCDIYSGIGEKVANKIKIIGESVQNYSSNDSVISVSDHDEVKSEPCSKNKPTRKPRLRMIDSLDINDKPRKRKTPSTRSMAQGQKRKSKEGRPNQTSKKRRSNKRRSPRQVDIESRSNTRVIGTIVLDDDSGYAMTNLAPIDFNSRRKMKSNVTNTSEFSSSSIVDLDSSGDEMPALDNECDCTVTLEWQGEKKARKTFKLRKYQTFESVFEELAKTEKIPKSRVYLMHGLKTVRPSDTPSSRNFQHYAALSGCISKVDIDFDKIVYLSDSEDKADENRLFVKIQLETRTFSLSILKHQKMSVLYEKCCEELNCSESELKITFEGETVDPSETVSDLDLEGGEIFNVYFRK